MNVMLHNAAFKVLEELHKVDITVAKISYGDTNEFLAEFHTSPVSLDRQGNMIDENKNTPSLEELVEKLPNRVELLICGEKQKFYITPASMEDN